MASPFYLFRKYQRAFIAIAAVVAMFIFVVADPLMSWLQSSGGGGQRSGKMVVASWDGGEVNLAQLERLTQRRYRISQFLRVMVERAARQIQDEGGTLLPPNLPDFRIRNNDPSVVQQDCVLTQVFADLAKDSGISVSDAFINHYLKEWGLGKTSDAEIVDLLGQVGITDQVLFAGLRELLMRHFYTSSLAVATAGALPEERWQDWKRINERIVVEAAVLPVENFVSEVPEPTETELKQFYEQYKDQIGGSFELVMQVPLPRPTPGFREPRQVKIQYLVANVDDRAQDLLDSVTDEEIADYYERNKRTMFVNTSSSSSTTTSAEGLFDDEMQDDEMQEDDESPADEESTTGGESEATESEADPEDGSEETADGLGEAEDAVETSPEESSEGPTENPSDQDSGSLTTKKSPFRLVAIQNETEEATEESSAEAEETQTESDAAETTDEAPSTNDGGDAEPSTNEDEEETVEFAPLEEVEDQIRRSLAVDKAVVELQETVDQTFRKLQTAYNRYGSDVVDAETDEREIPEPPAELSDFKAIAADTGLASEETVLLSQKELSETFVGRAVDAQTRTRLVHQIMFGDLEPYEPLRAIDLTGNSYIVCKTEDVASRVPEFEEVQDAVTTAWKKAEAAKLAMAKAEDLAKAAEESGDTVAVVAGQEGFEVVTTDAFSWLTFGTTQAEMQRGPRLGEAPPLESVGIDFMTKAFELQPNEKSAVMNHDESAAYVIRLDQRERTEEELQQQFLSDSVNGWFGGQMMEFVRREVSQRQFQAKLSDEINLNIDNLRELLSNNAQ